MYIITNPKVNLAIKSFVNKKVVYGNTIYSTVHQQDKEFIQQFLNRFYFAFETLFYDKHDAANIFTSRLKVLDAIRINSEDENNMPFKFAFDEMKDSHGYLEGGIFVPTRTYGVVIIDMDFINKSKAEAIHTLIHEIIHAMCLIEVRGDEGTEYKCGVNRNGRAFNRLNEGITEFIAQQMWKHMYKNNPCPGVGRYALEVEAARLIMEKYDSQEEFIEDYITSGIAVEREMKKIKNNNNENLFDFINSFDNADFKDVKIQEKFIEELSHFNSKNYSYKNKKTHLN